MSAYELERLERIEANKRRMAQLGVLERAKSLARDAQKKRKKTNCSNAFERTSNEENKGSAAPVRASRRVRNEEPEAFDPNDASRDLFEVRYNEEVYEARHAEARGSAAEPWTLFEDGYDDKGRRIYDPVNGQCCHQCRQKTKGLRTSCAGCEMMRGVYCGDCLYMRQGLNIREVIARGDAWRCPSCLDICNCSFCRTKKGYPPTGTMYRRSLAMGYDSVAHYLVLTGQKDEAARARYEAEAAVKAEAYAKREAEAEALRESDENAPDRKPHWLKEKVIASE